MVRNYLIIAATLGLLYFYTGVFIPFFLSFLSAYSLNNTIQKICIVSKLPRYIVSFFVVLLIAIGFTSIIFFFVPIFLSQFSSLSKTLSLYAMKMQFKIVPLISSTFNSVLNSTGENDFLKEITNNISNIVSSINAGILSSTKYVIGGMWSYTLSTVSFIVNILLMPILLFYFFKDFDEIVFDLKKNLIKHFGARCISLISEINNIMASYVKAQLVVCFILTVYYYCVLRIAGVDFYLVISVLSGILILIPFLGFLVSLLMSVLVYILDFGFDSGIYIIIAGYSIGQALEGWFLTPKIVGEKIGIHPIIMLLGIILFSNMFGFYGMIISIPMLCLIKIVLRFLFSENNLNYKS